MASPSRTTADSRTGTGSSRGAGATTGGAVDNGRRRDPVTGRWVSGATDPIELEDAAVERASAGAALGVGASVEAAQGEPRAHLLDAGLPDLPETVSPTVRSPGWRSTSGSSSSRRTRTCRCWSGCMFLSIFALEPRRVLHGARRRPQAPDRRPAWRYTDGLPGSPPTPACSRRSGRGRPPELIAPARQGGSSTQVQPALADEGIHAGALGRARRQRAESAYSKVLPNRRSSLLTPLAVDPRTRSRTSPGCPSTSPSWW